MRVIYSQLQLYNRSLYVNPPNASMRGMFVRGVQKSNNAINATKTKIDRADSSTSNDVVECPRGWLAFLRKVDTLAITGRN